MFDKSQLRSGRRKRITKTTALTNANAPQRRTIGRRQLPRWMRLSARIRKLLRQTTSITCAAESLKTRTTGSVRLRNSIRLLRRTRYIRSRYGTQCELQFSFRIKHQPRSFCRRCPGTFRLSSKCGSRALAPIGKGPGKQRNRKRGSRRNTGRSS